MLEDSSSSGEIPLPTMDRALLDSDDSDFYDPDLGKYEIKDYTKYLPPLHPKHKQVSIVPKDSVIQMKGFAPN